MNYSRKLYPVLAKLLVPLTNSVPFSLSGLLLIFLPLLWLALLLRSFRLKTVLNWFGVWLWRSFAALLVIGVLFVFIWGANYRRESIETQFGLQLIAQSQTDLEHLLLSLVGVIQRDVAVESRAESTALLSLKRSLEQTVFEVTGVKSTLPEKVKRLPAGSLILLGSASGVMSPWTLEPHIDGALLDVSRLAIGAHELAHVAGYAGEADADFLAALAGLRADDAFARYAVALRLFQDALWQLPAELRSGYELQLPQVARDDLRRMLEPYQKYRLPIFIRKVQRGTYDAYLKTQGVEQGIADYSRTVQLLIAAQKQDLLKLGENRVDP